MKCKEAEISILLQDSGELGSAKAKALSEHLSECAPCREFKQVLVGAASVSLPEEEPPIRAIQDVMRMARIEAPERRKKIFFGWKPALASALSFVFIMGVMSTGLHTDKVGMQLMVTETQLMEPEDQVVTVMYEGLSEDDLAFHFLMSYDSDS
ncbi:MAG: hypothetical protein JXR25_01080 [Pontiellaceae bacterium]|nr:hypothetical protein [Pontiellaceae bacterium]MBN2783392.1 hypothetical protein [Pontiellaceae bacterium]